MLSRGIEGGLGVVLGVLRDLQVSQRYGPVLVQLLRSIQLLARKELIGDGLVVGVEASRNVVAANTQQELALLYCVAEASADVHNAAGGKRNHRNISRDVRNYSAGYEQLRRGLVFGRCYDRIQLRMVDREKRDVHSGNHLSLWRSLFVCLHLIALAATDGQRCGHHRQRQAKSNTNVLHTISHTSFAFSGRSGTRPSCSIGEVLRGGRSAQYLAGLEQHRSSRELRCCSSS